MNIHKNENSLKNSYINKKDSKKISLFNLKIIHKIFDSINISSLILIFILSFLSLKSQKEWTTIYKNLANTRLKNNNLIDYISNTEEFYINEIEILNTFKKTTPKDLIYLRRQISKQKINNLNKNLKYIQNGIRDSRYHRGY